MGGGLMQLVAYGAQDIYLTGNPQITFFKVVYRRHTNFSMEAIQQTIDGSSQLGTSASSGSVTISRNGDLVHKIYITSSTAGIINGDALISDVELEIGGQKIDKHYTEWNQIWNELSTPSSKASGLKSMKCCVSPHNQLSHGSGGTSANRGVGMVQLPLNFWFCRNPGLALPLIALQYHEVKLKIKWGTDSSTSAGTTASCKVFCDYIYLDTDERRRFAQVSHEYLIEQLQVQSASNSNSQALNFNHPVKELIWTSAEGNNYGTAKLILNGHDRFSAQEEEYFQLRQPYDHHTTVPVNNLPASWHIGTNTASNTVISKGHLIHTDSQGLAAAVCTTTSLTWVKVNDTTEVVNYTPTNEGIANANNEASCFIIGALDNVSGIKPNSLRIGDSHQITITNADTGKTSQHTGIVGNVFLSDAASYDTKAEVSGVNGPLNLGSEATEATLVSGAGAAQITAGTGGAIMVCYENTISFSTVDGFGNQSAFFLDSGNDFTEITNLTAHLGDPTVSNGHEAGTSLLTKKINVYSFALKPEEHQPSGTCNFSRIDNAKLNTNLALATGDNIYAVNYNVLRIMSGMGGLAYSN
jgi:hypothetical protein